MNSRPRPVMDVFKSDRSSRAADRLYRNYAKGQMLTRPAGTSRPAAFAPPALRRASPKLGLDAPERRREGRPLPIFQVRLKPR